MPGTYGRHLCRGIFAGRRAPGDRRIRRPGPAVSYEGLHPGKGLRSGPDGRGCAMTCTARCRVLLLTAWTLIVSASNLAAQPAITDLQPRGAQRGKPFTLTIVGRNLGGGAKVGSTMPASFTLL